MGATPAGAALVCLGRIGAPHGIRGWNRLRSDTEPPQGIFEYRVWSLRSAAGVQEFSVSGASRSDRALTVKLNGIDTRDAAAALCGALICVRREALKPTAPREFYRTDLLGCRVVDEAGRVLGVLEYFSETAAHAVMVIRGEREIWLPAVAKHLRRVDLPTRTVVVRMLEDSDVT